jgi:hypothetical protein
VASHRRAYGILVFGTIVAGLAIHLHGIGLATAARDVLGDALWAAMVLWLVSMAAPNAGIPWRATAAVAICAAVELSQLIQHPVLEIVRGSTFGHLVIGSDFDARDLAAYCGGIAVAALVDRVMRTRSLCIPDR